MATRIVSEGSARIDPIYRARVELLSRYYGLYRAAYAAAWRLCRESVPDARWLAVGKRWERTYHRLTHPCVRHIPEHPIRCPDTRHPGRGNRARRRIQALMATEAGLAGRVGPR